MARFSDDAISNIQSTVFLYIDTNPFTDNSNLTAIAENLNLATLSGISANAIPIVQMEEIFSGTLTHLLELSIPSITAQVLSEGYINETTPSAVMGGAVGSVIYDGVMTTPADNSTGVMESQLIFIFSSNLIADDTTFNLTFQNINEQRLIAESKNSDLNAQVERLNMGTLNGQSEESLAAAGVETIHAADIALISANSVPTVASENIRDAVLISGSDNSAITITVQLVVDATGAIIADGTIGSITTQLSNLGDMLGATDSSMAAMTSQTINSLGIFYSASNDTSAMGISILTLQLFGFGR